jgi:hypothetical protein
VEIIKRLEASGHQVINMADKMKAIGFVGGIGAHKINLQRSKTRNLALHRMENDCARL